VGGRYYLPVRLSLEIPYRTVLPYAAITHAVSCNSHGHVGGKIGQREQCARGSHGYGAAGVETEEIDAGLIGDSDICPDVELRKFR
jgi:hypothetical protein